jgi:hypothetical protein
MVAALIILVYLIGYALSYYLIEKSILKEKNYTVGDLKYNMIISIFSWASVISVLVEALSNMTCDDSKIIKKKK